MIVYLDEVWLLNSVVDYLLLVVCGRMASQPVRRCRLILAGAVGGGIAVLSSFPAWCFMRAPLWIFVGALLLAMIAFGIGKRTIWLSILLLLLTAGFAGVVVFLTEVFSAPNSLLRGHIYYPSNGSVLVLTAGCTASLALWAIRRFSMHGGTVVPVTVTLCGAELTVQALRDTGNTLRDPISGIPVMIVYQGILNGVMPLSAKDDAEETVRMIHTLFPEYKPRLIPYRAVGVERGMLAAIRPENVVIEGKPVNLLLGLASAPVSDDGVYDALLGGSYD